MTDDETRSETLSARVSLAISPRLEAEIESKLDEPGAKSEWIRDAIREKLDRKQATEPTEPASE